MPLLACSGGCEKIQEIFGMKSGYLFVGQDAAGVPGQDVIVGARLQKGSFFDDIEGRNIRFYRGDRMVAQSRTGDEGVASFNYKADTAGDYHFEARCQVSRKDQEEIKTQAMLAVRPAHTPLCVVDIDKTLVASGFKKVLRDEARPMEGSQRVMERLAVGRLVIYLTARPDYLGVLSRDWLRKHRYPDAPILTSDVEQLLGGSRSYKNEVLGMLRRDFTGPGVGIGNTSGDMKAYIENGLAAIFVLHISNEDRRDKDELRDKVEKLRELPPAVSVAWGWDEVEAAVFDQKDLPAERAIRRLEEMIERIVD